MINKVNIFDNIKPFSENEIFEDLFKSEKLKVERIISYPDSIPENKWYDQEKDEWVILLKGSATLQFENEELVKLIPGDYIFIPSHTKHKVNEVCKNEPTVWLAMHFQ